MALISSLVPDVQAEIPELPSFIAERQLLRAARLFCEETRAWRVDVSLSVTTTVATVDIQTLLPDLTELVDIISMKNVIGGEPVRPRTPTWLDINETDWRSDTDLNARYYLLSSNNTLRLVPTPADTVADQYYLRAAVKPLLTATEIGDVIANKYDEVLVHGALARLYLIPRKPWTDLNLGQYHQTIFGAAIAPARTEAADEFQTGVARKVRYGGL